MPYNNAPIAPPEEVTGSSSLPLARVKKIIGQDEEIAQCSNGAAFAISVATEIFVRYLTEQAQSVVKSERKPRRNIAYKDIATAVSRIDNLEFLSDVVPKTKTYRQFREEKAREEEAAAAKRAHAVKPNGVNGEQPTKPIEQMLLQQSAETMEAPVNGHTTAGGPSHSASIPLDSLVERTAYQNGDGQHHPPGDVEMSG